MKRPTIISLGEVLWDLFPDGERFGGAPANFACHVAILGADLSMVSAVGDDASRSGSRTPSRMRRSGECDDKRQVC
jgi:sugar/nucleoside kinase (ribokinase family)